MTEKSCNLSEKRVDLPREGENATSSASLSNTYRKELSRTHFTFPRVQERLQSEDQQIV